MMKKLGLILSLLSLPVLMGASYPIPIPGSSGNVMTSNGSKWVSTSTAAVATAATTTTITDDTTTNATMYPSWVTTASGNQSQKVSSTKWSFNPSTGMMTVTGITSALTGNATTATSATTATNATNTAITDDTTTNATMYPTWVTANTGNLPQKVSSTKISFNPSTGSLTSTTFIGALTGTASGNTTYTANQYGVVLSGAGNAMVVLAPDASTTKVLTSGGAAANPTWSTVTATAPTSSSDIKNLGLATSVGSSALTIALKQADGATDPAAGGGAVLVGMRSATLTSGAYNQRSATAATSIVIPSGATMGQTNAKPWIIWIYLIDNAGTLELAVSGSFFHENQVLTSTTIDTGADSATVLYSTTGRSSVPVRLIGKLLNTQTTAGTWASAGTTLQVGALSALTTFTAPTIQNLTSGTTYYTPAGVKYLRVRMVGGGGGGGGSGTGAGTAATAGTASTFGSQLSAGGGALGGFSADGGVGGTATLGTGPIGTALNGGKGGGSVYQDLTTTVRPLSGPGGISAFGGSGSVDRYDHTPTAPIANSGGGGAGAPTANVSACVGGAGGGAGGYVDAILVSPATTYAYVVGAAGAGGGAGASGIAGGAGAAGYIEVTEYYQ